MHNYPRKLLTEWRKLGMPFDGENVLIAVSGGADSISLAAALAELVKAKKFGHTFIVAHFNHGLRGEDSDCDQAFVKTMARNFGFEYVGGKAKALKASSANLEEHARQERYEFLRKSAVRKKANIVLTAHTLDDQAETFLLRLLRGSGTDGLGSMRAKRELEPNSNILLVRPLVSWSYRKDTEDYCKRHGIEYRHDEMNEDERFKRVKVRKKLLPLLKEFNPKIIASLAQTAQFMQQDSETLDRAATACLAKAVGKQREMAIKELIEVPESLRLRVLRLWIGKEQMNLRGIDSTHIESILKLALSPKSGRLAELPSGKCVIKRNGKLFFGKTKVEKSRSGN